MTDTALPVDDFTLTLIEEALNTSYAVDEHGNHTLVGGQFTLPMLLNFFAGYDPADLQEIAPGIAEYKGISLHPHDLIRALINEVRRLRHPE